MKTRKLRKAILTLCSALLLVSLSVGLTVAYLTDETEVVQNSFTVGNVVITLDETKVDEYGVAVTPAERTQANTYKLLPNHEYVKDPTVHVAEKSEPSYVRVYVQITDVADLMAACDTDNFLPENYVGGWMSDVWVSKNYTIKDNVALCEFWYHNIVDARNAAQDLEPVFTSIKVPENATNDEIAALADMKINVIAQAIQADGFDNADAAWATWTADPDFTNLPAADDTTGA